MAGSQRLQLTGLVVQLHAQVRFHLFGALLFICQGLFARGQLRAGSPQISFSLFAAHVQCLSGFVGVAHATAQGVALGMQVARLGDELADADGEMV